MTPAEILKAAKAKIADPERLCRGELAVDSASTAVSPRAPGACKWCAEGATYAAAGDSDDDAFCFLSSAAAKLFGCPPHHVNDTKTHADVMAMFDKAIELAEASA